MNVVLIGMPTAGKSTVGVILAKVMGLEFVDTRRPFRNCNRWQRSNGYEAMRHLRQIGTVILSYGTIQQRIEDAKQRGVVLRGNQTLLQLYQERCLLYESYADITIDAEHLGVEQVVEQKHNSVVFLKRKVEKAGTPWNNRLFLDRLTSLLKDELEGSLTGIYLHGSMAMGCFHPAQSDIDILVVVKARQSIACYKKIANKLMALEEAFNLVKGFELSVVLETYAAHFIYPTPFEFHYSSDHREKYSTDDRYFCGGLDDPDLAAHFVVLYDRGIVLFGDPIKQVFNPIDSQYYMESIKLDVDGAIQGITENPVYYVLNLARVLLYVKEGNISSKKEAGEWALNELPKQFEGILSQCLAQYEGRAECLTIEDNLLINYACYMLTVIEDLM